MNTTALAHRRSPVIEVSVEELRWSRSFAGVFLGIGNGISGDGDRTGEGVMRRQTRGKWRKCGGAGTHSSQGLCLPWGFLERDESGGDVKSKCDLGETLTERSTEQIVYVARRAIAAKTNQTVSWLELDIGVGVGYR